MTNKAKKLLTERIDNTYVSLDDVLNGGRYSGFNHIETGYINGQYCKLVASGHTLSIDQIKNFWKYVDANLKLSDWIFLVGAQARFCVERDFDSIDKLLKHDISKTVNGEEHKMVHCKVIINTFRKSADYFKQAMAEALKSGIATVEEVEELAEKIRVKEDYKTPNRNSYQLLMEKYEEK